MLIQGPSRTHTGPLSFVFRVSPPPPSPAQSTLYLNGVHHKRCNLAPAASLPEEEKSRLRSSHTRLCAGEATQTLPLSKSFFKSRIWRAPEALPQTSAEFGVFPSQCGDLCFINAENQTSTQPAWRGETSSVLWDLTMCQCDIVGPRFLPSAPKIPRDCVSTIQGVT